MKELKTQLKQVEEGSLKFWGQVSPSRSTPQPLFAEVPVTATADPPTSSVSPGTWLLLSRPIKRVDRDLPGRILTENWFRTYMVDKVTGAPTQLYVCNVNQDGTPVFSQFDTFLWD